MNTDTDGSFDVDKFLSEHDTMKFFNDVRLNRPSTYDYIRILFKQAYLSGSTDALSSAIFKYKD